MFIVYYKAFIQPDMYVTEPWHRTMDAYLNCNESSWLVPGTYHE